MKDCVEDLIESAKNKLNPNHLRCGWIIRARVTLSELNDELVKLEEELK